MYAHIEQYNVCVTHIYVYICIHVLINQKLILMSDIFIQGIALLLCNRILKNRHAHFNFFSIQIFH